MIRKVGVPGSIVPSSDAMLFCTCAEINQSTYLDRVWAWFDYVHKYIDADLYVVNDGKILPQFRERCEQSPITFIEFDRSLGRKNMHCFPGWRRSASTALKISGNYKYFGHIESDCFVKDIKGFNAKLHSDGNYIGYNLNNNFPESAAMIINDRQTRYDLSVLFSDTREVTRGNDVEDQLAPFLVGAETLGYSVRLEHGKCNDIQADIVCQCSPEVLSRLANGGEDVPTFSHSGKLGDLIYSLNFAKEYTEWRGFDKFNLRLQYFADETDGSTRMTPEGCYWIKPLLEYQPYINKVWLDRGNPTTGFNLDVFRTIDISLAAGDNRYWYYRAFPNSLPKDFTSPILTAPTSPVYKDKILIARSMRYREARTDYKQLAPIADKIMFVGTPGEHRDFCKAFFQCQQCPSNTALELATAINSCRMFIGNQSAPYAIAEQLKVPRWLESNDSGCPNVIPFGGKCWMMTNKPNIPIIEDFLK